MEIEFRIRFSTYFDDNFIVFVIFFQKPDKYHTNKRHFGLKFESLITIIYTSQFKNYQGQPCFQFWEPSKK